MKPKQRRTKTRWHLAMLVLLVLVAIEPVQNAFGALLFQDSFEYSVGKAGDIVTPW